MVGWRANFCEFCACVSRHEVVAFQSSPTVFFIPLNWETKYLENRCEICHAQFGLAEDAKWLECDRDDAPTGPDILLLVKQTNPAIVQIASKEIAHRLESPGARDRIQLGRIRNFLRNYQRECEHHYRGLFPNFALFSFHALLAIVAIAMISNWQLAIAFGCSFYLMLCLSTVVRHRNAFHRKMDGAVTRLAAVCEMTTDELASKLHDLLPKFPAIAAEIKKQLEAIDRQDHSSFQSGKDYLNVLAPNRKTP